MEIQKLIDRLGYKDNSPFKEESYLQINSPFITTKGVSKDLIGIGDDGSIKVMKPGKNYVYPNAKSVIEIPMKQKGGKIKTNGFEQYLSSLTEEEQDQLIDHMEGLSDIDREKFMNGGYTKYQHGGKVSVEVEDKETIQTPNGELYQFNGKKHSEGGIQTQLEPGSKIYSQYLKVNPGIVKAVLGKESEDMSYADLSKKFDTTKFSKILKNPDSDKYKQETAKVKLSLNKAMLDTIFTAQELEKEKGNPDTTYQEGGMIPTETPLERIKRIYGTTNKTELENILNENLFGQPTSPTILGEGTKGVPFNPVQQEDYSFPGIHEEPSSTVTTGVVLNQKGLGEINPNLVPAKSTNELTIVEPSRNKPVSKLPVRSSKSRAITTSDLSAPVTDNMRSWKPLDPLPTNLNEVSYERPLNTEDYKVTPVTNEEIIKERKFGINPKLAGTILDIGLVASDKLRVINPQYRDLRKYPLFSRFVDFDDKEVGRNMALNVEQIQNSNMPEEVKQARIQDLNAQYKDYQAKIDFGNAQRYEQKLNQDTEKLQNYINSNIDQHYQDIETYNQKKARVDFLKDQFNAQKKSRIVNSLKSYGNYVEDTTYKNALAKQMYGDSYSMNVLTGNIDRIQGQKDPFLEQERGLSQYAQQNNNVKNLPNGATLTMLNSTTGIVVDANGKTTMVKL